MTHSLSAVYKPGKVLLGTNQSFQVKSKEEQGKGKGKTLWKHKFLSCMDKKSWNLWFLFSVYKEQDQFDDFGVPLFCRKWRPPIFILFLFPHLGEVGEGSVQRAVVSGRKKKKLHKARAVRMAFAWIISEGLSGCCCCFWVARIRLRTVVRVSLCKVGKEEEEEGISQGSFLLLLLHTPKMVVVTLLNPNSITHFCRRLLLLLLLLFRKALQPDWVVYNLPSFLPPEKISTLSSSSSSSFS